MKKQINEETKGTEDRPSEAWYEKEKWEKSGHRQKEKLMTRHTEMEKDCHKYKSPWQKCH
jgi:hypothetical protein